MQYRFPATGQPTRVLPPGCFSYLGAARIGRFASGGRLVGTYPNRRSPFSLQTFELSPLWMFPNYTVLNQLAESLFAHSDSHLAPGNDCERAATPLHGNPVYRRSVISALDDNTVVASATGDSKTNNFDSLCKRRRRVCVWAARLIRGTCGLVAAGRSA